METLTPPEPKQPLTAISVAGFKSINHEQTLHIAPLTILAGANSSGKSSIMQPLLLMKQTLEAPYNPGIFLLDGPNVNFTSSTQILFHRKDHEQKCFFSVSFISNKYKTEFLYTRNADENFSFSSISLSNKDAQNIYFSRGNNTTEIIDKIRTLFPEINLSLQNIQSAEWLYNRFFCDMIVTIQTETLLGSTYALSLSAFKFENIKKLILSTIHVPGLRGNPTRTYKTSAIGNKFPGTFQNYAAGIINFWQKNNVSLIQKLNSNLKYLELTSEVSATPIDGTQVEIKVGRLPNSRMNAPTDLVNIADVGVGVSQTLPVLVALLAAEPGQLVYIEQPEIHLHPRAQFKLAAVIAEASKRGVLVVIETHSDILLRGVQTLVAKGELDPAIVKLHWFSRSPEDGSTTVTCAELDENGAFGDWPQDFDTTALDAEKAYLDAVEKRLSRHEK